MASSQKRTRKVATKKAAPKKKVASKAKVKTKPKKAAAVTKPRAGKASKPKLTRVDLFVLEYLKDFNGRRSAMAAGYSAHTARQIANELLNKPAIEAKVQAAMRERADRTGIEADAVLKRLYAIATADPRDLIELYRCNCRYCWGQDHKYQRTPSEMERDRKALEDEAAQANKEPEPFDEQGGPGWDAYADPNPKCPECFGRGEERVVAKDTRDLSPEAQLLYAGAKTTQHGLEIKMHDQPGMLINVGKHLGMFAKNVNVKGEIKHQGLSDVLDEIDGAGTGIPDHGDGD